MKWLDRPVLVSFADKTTFIGSIPFPAVTVCSTEKTTKEKVDMHRLVNALKTAMQTNEQEKSMNLTANE